MTPRRLDVARVNVDFSEVEEFEAMPKGNYDCVIEKVEVRDSNSSDYQYLNWELKVADGEFKDRRLWFITSFSPKALFRLKQTLENLGMYDEDLNFDFDDESGAVLDPVLVGLPCTAAVSQRVYNETMQNQVDAIVDTDASPGKTVPAGKKKEPAAKKPATKKTPAKSKKSFK